MKKLPVNLIIVILLVVVGLIIFQKKKQEANKVHYHAAFQVYVDGKLQDFSAAKFMHLKPCGEGHVSKEEEQLDKAHLHDGVGDVVHVHRENALWKDLFTNLHFNFNNSKSLEGYINGKKVDNVLDRKISEYDSIVIFNGKVEDQNSKLRKQVGKNRIQEVEKQSESCGNS